MNERTSEGMSERTNERTNHFFLAALLYFSYDILFFTSHLLPECEAFISCEERFQVLDLE